MKDKGWMPCENTPYHIARTKILFAVIDNQQFLGKRFTPHLLRPCIILKEKRWFYYPVTRPPINSGAKGGEETG